MMKNWLAAGAVALTAGMTSTVAYAQTTTVPGEQVGLRLSGISCGAAIVDPKEDPDGTTQSPPHP